MATRNPIKPLDVELLCIRAYSELDLYKLHAKHWWSKQYWVLQSRYHAEFVTSDGVWHLDLSPGWITDKRSGSKAVDLIVPKWGNKEFQAVVSGHDTSYSGWMSQQYSDELFVHQGFYMSGEVTEKEADIARKVVSVFGSAYHMEDTMPKPYTDNRKFESLILKDR